MEDFFQETDMISLKKHSTQEITLTFGVCDEDMYNKAIGVMNKEAKENKPLIIL
jgi:hypothetical protein